jgi:Ca2+-transporting ATPase
MITGDHPATARAAAGAVGIAGGRCLTGAELDRLSAAELRQAVREVDVFARVDPTHKLAIVDALRAVGEIVAVTGDGVNDAPALKRSDVGVAMGQRGSDVAREVADLVLVDDNFASIVAAIEEGRNIFENIHKFIRYTFSTNVALMLVVIVGAVAAYALGLRDAAGMVVLPLSAAQLLWINFIGDGPPALALALDRDPGVMTRAPRPPSSSFLGGANLRYIVVTGAIKGAVGIALLLLFAGAGVEILAIRAALFLYESIAKLASAYSARRVGAAPPRRNLALHASILLGVGLQLATLSWAPLRRVLEVETLSLAGWGIVAAAVALTWLVAELCGGRIQRAAAPQAAEG